uniref:Uncharacterized protein n=1 Tax=Romanomermis culicivorax TaxID=13658 RepID=A0A915JIM2_ROMCU
MHFTEKSSLHYNWLWSKRTLAELFVITTCNKIKSHEMAWVRDVQQRSNLRTSLPKAFIDGIKKGILEYENDHSPEAEQGRKLYATVTTLNMHDYNKDSPCMVDVIRQWVNGPQGTAIVFHERYEREAQSDATGAKKRSTTGAKKRSMTQAYFDVCRESPLAKMLTYDQLGKYFRFDTKERRWLPRKKGNPDKYIVRVGNVWPVNRELFCVQILLFNIRGPTSFEKLRTVDSKVYESMEGACAAKNLLDNNDVWRRTLVDALNERMGVQSFCRFFTLCIYHCIPARPLALLEEFVHYLVPFHLFKDQLEEDKQTALRFLEHLFLQWNTSCE